jgi:hypothetical protein
MANRQRIGGRSAPLAGAFADALTRRFCVSDGQRNHHDHGAAGNEAMVATRTGLVLSASKIAWLLDHVPGARAKAERGDLAFATVDTRSCCGG